MACACFRPFALTAAKFGLSPGEDFEATFSGANNSSILGVANQDYIATSIINAVEGRMFDREVITEEQLVTIYKSETLPTTG